LSLLLGLRRHDLRAARTWMTMLAPNRVGAARWGALLCWAVRQAWHEIPTAERETTFAARISRTPVWLDEGNPFDNHPWGQNPGAALPQRVDTLVIGAGFTGAALAYHWARRTQPDGERRMVVLEMGEAASGASGRNEGLVVMGRYCRMVYDTVSAHLGRLFPERSCSERDQLALRFAVAYCSAAYRNAELIEETVRNEGFDCDYHREGWVQARDPDQQGALAESVRMATETGMTDWTSIRPDEVERRTGMMTVADAGFSQGAASWHPARWVWCLLRRALAAGPVELYTRTRVERVEATAEEYRVHTSRGTIHARHVVNATESYTPLLHPQFHGRILPTQTQAASGTGGPEGMRPHVGISGPRGFFGRHGHRVMIGSDATRVPDHEAGRVQPSRFLTRFLLAEMCRYFGPFRYHITHEWSGTVGYTPDEYPVVGLMDGHRQYVIGGMAGSGSGVSFNAARCVVNRILGRDDEPDDYPEAYFGPSRLLDPAAHPWPWEPESTPECQTTARRD
jgi:glycine/D-amino acid oxidase-like deaminating enzyme